MPPRDRLGRVRLGRDVVAAACPAARRRAGRPAGGSADACPAVPGAPGIRWATGPRAEQGSWWSPTCGPAYLRREPVPVVTVHPVAVPMSAPARRRTASGDGVPVCGLSRVSGWRLQERRRPRRGTRRVARRARCGRCRVETNAAARDAGAPARPADPAACRTAAPPTTRVRARMSRREVPPGRVGIVAPGPQRGHRAPVAGLARLRCRSGSPAAGRPGAVAACPPAPAPGPGPGGSRPAGTRPPRPSSEPTTAAARTPRASIASSTSSRQVGELVRARPVALTVAARVQARSPGTVGRDPARPVPSRRRRSRARAAARPPARRDDPTPGSRA